MINEFENGKKRRTEIFGAVKMSTMRLDGRPSRACLEYNNRLFVFICTPSVAFFRRFTQTLTKSETFSMTLICMPFRLSAVDNPVNKDGNFGLFVLMKLKMRTQSQPNSIPSRSLGPCVRHFSAILISNWKFDTSSTVAMRRRTWRRLSRAHAFMANGIPQIPREMNDVNDRNDFLFGLGLSDDVNSRIARPLRVIWWGYNVVVQCLSLPRRTEGALQFCSCTFPLGFHAGTA